MRLDQEMRGIPDFDKSAVWKELMQSLIDQFAHWVRLFAMDQGNRDGHGLNFLQARCKGAIGGPLLDIKAGH